VHLAGDESACLGSPLSTSAQRVGEGGRRQRCYLWGAGGCEEVARAAEAGHERTHGATTVTAGQKPPHVVAKQYVALH
jgi:hypothetical protein